MKKGSKPWRLRMLGVLFVVISLLKGSVWTIGAFEGPTGTHDQGFESEIPEMLKSLMALILYPPTLYEIQNPNLLKDYTVSGAYDTQPGVLSLTSYQLQEASNPNFASATSYTGSDTFHISTNKPNGAYYCRVRGVNVYDPSEWNNVRSVVTSVGFYDSFSDSASGWPHQTAYSHDGVNFMYADYYNGTYRMTILRHDGGGNNRKMGIIEAPYTTTHTNYDAYVEHHFTQAGDAAVDPDEGKAGLIFGANGDFSTIYVIEWNFGGYCAVSRYRNASVPVSSFREGSNLIHEPLRGWQNCTAYGVRGGYDKINRFRVEVRNTTVNLYSYDSDGTQYLVYVFDDSALGNYRRTGLLTGAWDWTPVESRFNEYAVVIFDITSPISNAGSPDHVSSVSIPISWTASDDDSGVASTELWAKFGSGGTWASTGLTQSGTSGTFNYTPTQGEGRYYFATAATDNAGNVEPAPTGDGDTNTRYDITPPSSQVQVPELEREATVRLPWTASDNLSGVSSTRLWVKVGTQGAWTATGLSQSGTSGTFEYSFAQGEGVYYFATVATDRAGNQENAPTGTGDGGCEHQLYTPPSAPTLNPIANADGSGSYTVSWSSVNDATSYTLQEATTSSFTGATLVYSGNNTSTSIIGRTPGMYHYRIRAANPGGNSAWSNVQTVAVLADLYEPDDTCAQAHAISTHGTVQERTFHQHADEDWVVFTVTAGETYRIEGYVPVGSPADVSVEVYDQCVGDPLDDQHNTFSPGVRLEFTAPADGPLYLRWLNHDSAVYGTEVAYHVSVQALAAEATPGAVIIVAGRYRYHDPLQNNIHYAAGQVYQMFQNNGYPADRIYYLSTDLTQPGANALATVSNLEAAITTWTPGKVDEERPLTLYLVDHGIPNRLYLDEPAGEWVTPAQLDTWLAQVEAAQPDLHVNVFVEACYSGSFIGLPQSLSQAGRVVVASTGATNLAYASDRGAIFSDHFSAALDQGASVYGAFESAWGATRTAYPYQTPWLDANGNGIPNEPADAQIAALRGFAYAGTLSSDQWPPYIAQVAPVTLSQGVGDLRVEARDDGEVRYVWAVIYPPSYTPPTTQEELVRETLPTVMLLSQGSDWYGATHTGFNEIGEYRVVFYAEDDLGLSAQPVAITVRTGWAVYLPLVLK